MKTTALLLGACTLVGLPMGTAAAGQCTTEIENMTKLLASRDAGAGPTAGAGASIGGRRARLLEGVPSPLPGGPSRRATTGFAAAWSAMAGSGEPPGTELSLGVSAAARLLPRSTHYVA